jgi:hypothetical protein
VRQAFNDVKFNSALFARLLAGEGFALIQRVRRAGKHVACVASQIFALVPTIQSWLSMLAFRNNC